MLEILSTDILRLIQAHLLEAGLHRSWEALRKETGVGLAGPLVNNYEFHARSGNWGAVLESLRRIDRTSNRYKNQSREEEEEALLAEVHEMAILELAEAEGGLALAYAAYRLVQQELAVEFVSENGMNSLPSLKQKKKNAPVVMDIRSDGRMTRARLVEQKLAALASKVQSTATTEGKDHEVVIPDDFYGFGVTRQQRRDDIGKRLQEMFPTTPKLRLITLLQQAVMWQSHTGQLPQIKRLWNESDGDAAENNEEFPGDATALVPSKKKRYHKKRKRQRTEFDLVMGIATVDPVPVGTVLDRSQLPKETIPHAPYATIKFGSHSRAQAAVFLPNGSGLVTGSSDGLIEVWDAAQKYSTLLPLEYQSKEELMGHNPDTPITALTISNDGEVLVSADGMGFVKVWKVESGRCLRSWQAHSHSVNCLALAPDASHVLTGSRDGLCREFGIRTTRVLKEFSHGSYVSACLYYLAASTTVETYIKNNKNKGDEINNDTERLLVLTASGDGTVRMWNRASHELMRTLGPISSSGVSPLLWTKVGSSIVIPDNVAGDGAWSSSSFSEPHIMGRPAIHTLIPLHTPPCTFVMVPRGPRAFLVHESGSVLQIFQSKLPAKTDLSSNPIANKNQSTTASTTFVTAAVSCTNQWLYLVSEDGECHVFHVETGELETSIPNFGTQTIRLYKSSEHHSSCRAEATLSSAVNTAEISSLLHHPNKSYLAAFSTSLRQQKGQVVLWK